MNLFLSAVAGAIVLNIPTAVWATALLGPSSGASAVGLIFVAAVLALLGAVLGSLVFWAASDDSVGRVSTSHHGGWASAPTPPEPVRIPWQPIR